MFGQPQVEYQDGRLGGHQGGIVQDGKDVFAAAESGPPALVDVDVVPSEAIVNSKADGEGQEKGKEPCEHHDAVIPGDVAHDKGARDHAGSDKDGGEDEGRGGDGEDGRPAIGEASIVGGGGRVGHVEVGLGDMGLIESRRDPEKG